MAIDTQGLQVAQVAAFCQAQALLAPGSRVLVGVSGGADSMALLHVLCALRATWGLNVRAAHFHHGIRAASDAEERFVREICAAWQLPLVVGHGDACTYARTHGVSLEVAARTLRHEFFRDQCHAEEVLALAHHRDDQAETVLLRLVRGSGCEGLGGMRARQGRIVRPLLGCSRAQIEAYCQREGIAFVQDESNADTDIPRNFLRHEILPKLHTLNASLADTLCRTATLMQADADYFAAQCEPYLAQCREERGEVLYPLDTLRALPQALRSRVLRALAQRAGMQQDVEWVHIHALQQLLQAQTGAQVDLGWGVAAALDAQHLALFHPTAAQPFCQKLVLNGETRTPAGRFVCRSVPCVPGDVRTFHHHTRYLHTDALQNAVVRTRAPGDWLAPLGAPGSKKLKEYLIDCKIPRRHRQQLPLVCSGSQVLWVVGHAIDKSAAIAQNTDITEIIFEEAR